MGRLNEEKTCSSINTLHIKGVEKMKKAVFLILSIIFILSGCVYQAYDRPKNNDSEVWICKDPYFELYWGDKGEYRGKLCIGEDEYDIIHMEDYGPGIWIYEYVENVNYSSSAAMEYCLFDADANYAGDSFTITVEEDYKNLFDGTYPTLEFKKHNIIDYFKDEK